MFHTRPKLSHSDREYNSISDVHHDLCLTKTKYRSTRNVWFVAHSSRVSSRVGAFRK